MPFSNKDSQYDIKYLHYDNLGSIDTITDYNGLVVERMAYKPFGKQLNLDKYGNEVSTVSPTTNRGYTGHEHIKEAGFIHMNGRVYDPTIGRFLSADPHIQDSKDSQSYNRYTYVKNNPYKYTDPSGFFFKKLKKFFKAIVVIAVVAVVTFYTAGAMTGIVAGWGTTFGTAAGMGALTTTAIGSVIAGALTGAVAGFVGAALGTLLNGGSLGDGLKAGLTGAVFGAIGGAVAGGIGSEFGHSSSFLNGGGANAAAKAVVHGISRAAISKAQGGRWNTGFWSGFVSSGFSPGTTMGGTSSGGFALRTAIAGVMGGTASEISGGKFSNGAVSGAFVHMFNGENVVEKFLTIKKFNTPISSTNELANRLRGASEMGVALADHLDHLDYMKNRYEWSSSTYQNIDNHIRRLVPIIQVMYIEMAIGKEVNMKPFHNERLNFE